MRIAQIVTAWNDFFFTPQSPLPFAVFRILYGLLVLQCLVVQLLPDFGFWYGPLGVLSSEVPIKDFWRSPIFDLLVFTGDSTIGLYWFFAVAVISAVCVTIGLGTRYSACILFMCLVSMHYHNPMNINAGDCFLRITAFYLALSRAGEELSFDHWWKKRFAPSQLRAAYWPWAQRLFQIQIALVYWQTSMAKLSGTQWIDGSAVWYATRLEDMYRFPIPIIFDNIEICKLLSWSAVSIEVALWTLIWVKELRYWVLLAGLALHLGIDASISLPLFEWAFICSYVTFVDAADLKAFFVRVKAWRPRMGLTRAEAVKVSHPDHC